MCGSRGVLAVQAHDTSAAMFACQVGRQLRPLPLPKTAMCRPSQPAGGCGDVQSAPAASHLGMLLLPSLPRAGAQPGARGRKISAWQPTKAPRGGSHTTATSRSAGIWQGQASSCSGMCRDNQGSGSQSCWKSHLGVAVAARRPSSSTVTPGHPPARKSAQTSLNAPGMQSRATSRDLQL